MILNAIYSIGFVWIFSNDCWFLAYIFNLLFGIALYNKFEYYFVSGEKLSKKAIAVFSLLVLCTAFSHEYFKFLLLILLPSVYFFNIIFNPLSFSKRDFFKKIGIYFLFFFILLFNNFSSAYQLWLKDHLFQGKSINEYFTYLMKFFNAYSEFILKENLFYYLIVLLLVLIILSFVNDKERNKKFFICIFSVIFSALLFFVMIGIGDAHYDNNMYAVLPMHQGLRFCLKLTLITVIFSCFGYILSYIRTKSVYKQILVFVGFAAICFFYFNYNINLNNELYVPKNIRINSYIQEKVFILNKKINKDRIFYTYNNTDCFCDEGILYLIHTYSCTDEDYVIQHVCKAGDSHEICRKNMIETAYKKFRYKFTEKELQELNFSSLYDLNENDI